MTEPKESPSKTVHDGWSQRKSAQPADPAVRLGPGAYVDKVIDPYHERDENRGYVARWNARRYFMDAVAQLAPDCLSEILADDIIDMVMAPARISEVSYPSSPPHYVLRLTPILFSRDDDLFAGVNWANFDPESDPNVVTLSEPERGFLKRLGRSAVSHAWGIWSSRTVTSTDLGLPIKDYLRMASASEDDGQIYASQLEEVSEELTQRLHVWQGRWNLNASWVSMVAGTTICDAADRREHSEPLPTTFVLGDRWQDWHTGLNDTWLSASDLSVHVDDRWNPREENRGAARERLIRLVEAELDRIEVSVAAVSAPTPIKTRPVHFDWLARYQLNGESYQDIARSPGHSSRKALTRQSVTDAIESTAKLIGLEVRSPGPGGRPPSTSSA